MNKLNADTAKSVALVFSHIIDNERDSDHISIMESALERVEELYNGKFTIPSREVQEDDVKKTFDFLKNNAPSRDERYNYRANNDGERHPDRSLASAMEFVDTEARYVNGCIPSFRDWNVEYVLDGNVIEKRTYDHDDEIPLEPTINGVRHECERTERGNGEVTVYVSEHPIRDDVDVVINAKGDDFINMEGHNGPNVTDSETPINILASEFNWGMLGDTEIILNENPDDVIDFMESQGWAYSYDDEE